MADASAGTPEIPGVTGLEQLAATPRSLIYKAREGDQDVAVKVIMAESLSDAAYDRFEEEVRALVALPSHPNLVEVRRAGYTDDDEEHPYFIMEYLGGGSLSDRIAAGPMSWQDGTQAGIRLAAAVETAHRGGVMHGDISPDNVLLTMYGEPKLAGFHVALEEQGEPQTPAEIGHAAPEALEGAPPSPASEVYQLGSTVYTLLAGEHPFLRGNERSIVPVIKRVSSEPVPDLRERGVPDAVAAAVEQAMAKDPAERFATAEGFGRALQQAQVALGVPVAEMTILGAAGAAAAAGAAGDAAATTQMPAAEAAAAGAPITAPIPVVAPPAAGPPTGAAAGGPPPTGGKKSKTPLIVGGAVAAAVIIGLIVLLTGGGDDEDANRPPPSTRETTTTTEEEDETTTTEEETTTTTEVSVDDPAVFSEEDLRIALFEAFQLPEGFSEQDSGDVDPSDDLTLCGVAPPPEAVLGLVDVQFASDDQLTFIANAVTQLAGDEAEIYLDNTLAALPNCSEEGLTVIDVAEGDLGDQMVIAEVVSDADENVGGFIVMIRQFDVINLFVVVSQPTAEVDFTVELSETADENLSLLFE